MQYYSEKANTYYTNVREDLISLMPDFPNQTILEIGAGGGDTLVAVKERKLVKEAIGVDLFALEKTNQNHPFIDQFLILDIEKQDLPFAEGYFDTVICGDVLEHLVDPWQVVKKLTYYLKPGGTFIISVPNIRYYKALYKIVGNGNFAYDPEGGILDKTHLRFFCRKNVVELLNTAELKLQKVVPIDYHPKYKFSRKVQAFNLLTGRLFEEFFVHQYLGVATRVA
jgi:2-polyprenyl-3-methyl-5-hydroxy-6-metoxy-1,4-benzoquinol methylase